jgi:DNA repair photolyase
MHFKSYQTILSSTNGMNIYRGCTHGCIYCDSRSHCYQMDHDFEDVEVKLDAPLMLARALANKRVKAMIQTGSMSDPYLPLEKDLLYTRQCLEVIEQYDFGVTLLTKSDLILRDLDILKRISMKTKCVVQMTLTTFDESLCRIVEPNVATTKKRVEVLKAMNEHKIPTIVWLGPLLPMINDTIENLSGLLQYCKETNVKGIICFGFGMTLRDGNREYYYQQLDKSFPGLKASYIKRFGNAYQCGSTNHQLLMSVFTDFCEKNGIMYNIDEIFAYLRDFPLSKPEQLSLF